MAENKENDERKAQIAEVNKHIREGIQQLVIDIMFTEDADQWAYDLTYFPRDLMNAVLIYQHVASNIGIKAGRIDEERAVEFDQRLRQLVIDMTGYDPHEFWKDPKNFETTNETNKTNYAKRNGTTDNGGVSVVAVRRACIDSGKGQQWKTDR